MSFLLPGRAWCFLGWVCGHHVLKLPHSPALFLRARLPSMEEFRGHVLPQLHTASLRGGQDPTVGQQCWAATPRATLVVSLLFGACCPASQAGLRQVRGATVFSGLPHHPSLHMGRSPGQTGPGGWDAHEATPILDWRCWLPEGADPS